MNLSEQQLSPKADECRLLSLPPEIRHTIWTFALSEASPIVVRCPETGVKPGQPALLCACRQIRSEAIGIYFSNNTFSFSVCDGGHPDFPIPDSYYGKTFHRWIWETPAQCLRLIPGL